MDRKLATGKPTKAEPPAANWTADSSGTPIPTATGNLRPTATGIVTAAATSASGTRRGPGSCASQTLSWPPVVSMTASTQSTTAGLDQATHRPRHRARTDRR